MTRIPEKVLTTFLLSCITVLSGVAIELEVSGNNTMRYGNGELKNQFDDGVVERIYRENILDVDFDWRNFKLNLAGSVYSPAELPDTPGSARINDEGLLFSGISEEFRNLPTW
jgi:hypothetical protein